MHDARRHPLRHRRVLINVIRMIKRKLQDLAVCCSYQVDFLHEKRHSMKEFKRSYEVLDEIGRGGFGIVYEATRLADGASVAVKFVEHKHVRSWTMGRHLVPSEVSHLETCRQLRGVIELVDWFASSKGFLIVMERPEHSMDLFDVVSVHGPLDEPTAKFVFAQVVRTVRAMFELHGLLHRDIKDENLIVNMRSGMVKLVDFGATAYVGKAAKQEFQGTRSYCPPEWFRDKTYLPVEATTWSLGVLLFILLTGKLPFRNEIQICLGSVRFPPGLSKGACRLVKSCLTTATSTRASIAQVAEDAWMVDARNELYENPTFEQILMEIKVEPDGEVSRRNRDSMATDMESICTMVTAHEESLARSESRYDNVSSIEASTSDIYHSALEIFGEETAAPVKSASAYNLRNWKSRKSIFKSFDTELDPVSELELLTSVASSSSAEDLTIVETPKKVSRQRPLQFGDPSATLAVFQVAPSVQ